MRRTLALLTSLGFTPVAQAFDYFSGRDIDYWNEGKITPQSHEQPSGQYSGSTLVRAGDSKPFSWERYQDPRQAEFWDDGGDWIPPRPFRETAANPTAKNVAAYLKWQGRKAEVLGRFNQALNQSSEQESDSKIPWRALKIIYFYQSACPHCQASKAAIEEAQRQGALVHYIQLDFGLNPPLHHGSEPYDAKWRELIKVSQTPTWIFNFEGKSARHTGALSWADLNVAVSSLVKRSAL